MKKAAIYIRYSPRPSAEDCDSLEVQRTAIQNYCKLAGLDPAYEFSDAETSARKIPLGKRPGGAELLAILNRHAIKNIVVKHLSRAFRNTVDGLTQLDAWDRQGIALHLADQGGVSMNCSTATGRLLISMLLAVDQFEPMQTAERTSSAMKHKQANGRRMSNLPPIGKMIDPNDASLLIDHPAELLAIEHAIALKERGWSVRKIVKKLNEENTAGRQWNHVTLGRILKNAVAV